MDAFVYVPKDVHVEQPILLTAIQADPGTELARHTLIVLDEGAQAEVWEQQLSATADLDAVFNTVVELSVGDNAHLQIRLWAIAVGVAAGSSAPTAPRSAATRRSTGSRSGSDPPRAASGWRPA